MSFGLFGRLQCFYKVVKGASMCILSPWRIHHGWQGRFANLPKAQDYELPMLYAWDCLRINCWSLLYHLASFSAWSISWSLNHWSLAQFSSEHVGCAFESCLVEAFTKSNICAPGGASCEVSTLNLELACFIQMASAPQTGRGKQIAHHASAETPAHTSA